VSSDELGPRKQDRVVIVDWEVLIRFLLETPRELDKVRSAWPLFFDIVRNADQAGMFTSNYSGLARRYGVAVITVKKWRECLYRHFLIQSYSQGRFIAFRLLEPYLSFIKRADDQETHESNELKRLLALRKLLSKAIKEQTTESMTT